MRQKVLRSIVALLTGLLTLLVIAWAALWYYSQTEDFRTLLHERALAVIRDTIDGDVTFERISGSIWSELHFHRVSILQEGVEVIYSPRISVKVPLLRQALSVVFFSSFHIGRIEIADPILRLVQDEEKRWNLASLLKTPDEPAKPREASVFIDRVRVDGGEISASLADGREVGLRSLSLDGNIELSPSSMQIHLAQWKLVLDTEGYPDTRMGGSLVYEIKGSISSLNLQSVDMQTAGSRARVSGKIENLRSPRTALRIEVNRISASELRDLFALPLAQDLTGALRITGPLSGLKAEGVLRTADSELAGWISMDVAQEVPQYQGQIQIRRLALDRALKIGGLGGVLNGQASFSGETLKRSKASLRGSISDLTVQGWRVDHLAVSANLADQRLALKAEAGGQGGGANLESQVHLGEGLTYEMSLQARELDLEKLEGKKLRVPAKISGDLWIRGRGRRLAEANGKVKFALRPSSIGPIRIAEGNAAATLSRGRLIVHEAKFLAGETILTAQGQIGSIEDISGATVRYTLRAREIAPWLRLAGIEGKGSANLQGTASGSLTSLRLQGQANLSRFEVGKLSLQSGSLRWDLAGVGEAAAQGRFQASAQGVNAVFLFKTLEGDLSLKGRDPVDLRLNLVAQDKENRRHRLKAQADYRPGRAEIVLEELTLQFARGAWLMPQAAKIIVTEGTRVATDDFLLRRGDQALRVKGAFAWRGSQDLRVEIKRFPIEELRLLVNDLPDAAGLLNAQVDIRGTAASPIIESSLSASPLTVSGQTYAGLTGEARYLKERLNLDLVLGQDKEHSLTLTGGLPLHLGWAGEKAPAAAGEADLRVQSDGLSPAFLSLFYKEVQNIQGTLSMDLGLRGPLKNLRPGGKVGLSRGQMQVKALGLLVRDVEIRADLASNSLTITRLQARSGGGELTGSGTVTLKNYAAGDMRLNLGAEKFRLINTRQYKAAVSGRVTASGTVDEPSLRGSLIVAESQLRPDLALLRKGGPPPPDPTVIVVQSKEELAIRHELKKKAQETGLEDRSFEKTGFYQRLGLDLELIVPRDTWIQHEDASIELAGKVRAHKKPNEALALAGTVETVRGWYSFHGRKFRIEKGRIVFTGESEIDPRLDVVARYKLPKYHVDMLLGGTAKKPTLTLRSDPPLEQADVLSVLLFGKPVGALSASQQDALRSQAVKATADFVASDLRQSVARHLGLDNLEFDVGENLQGRVAVGKYVREDVFVSASQGLGKEKEQEYSIEYQIAPDWQLKSSTTSEGKSGIDLFWGKNY